jgi:hypothetical protein
MIIQTNLETLTAALSATPATTSPILYASYYESNTSTGLLTYAAVTGVVLAGTIPVQIVGPSAKTWIGRVLGAVDLVNTDTAPIIVTLFMNGAAFLKVQLAVGDNLLYSRQDGEFKVLDATGALKMTMTLPNAALITTPNTFAGTQTFSGLIVPTGALGIRGTVAADNPQAGSIGEVISSTVATGASIALTTVATANVTSIVLSPGDWDVDGRVCFTLASTTTMGYLSCGINTASATLPLNNAGVATQVGAGTNVVTDVTVDPSLSLSSVRINVSLATTVFLLARAKFATSTCKAYGSISARRMR